jgi:hypothetical protein
MTLSLSNRYIVLFIAIHYFLADVQATNFHSSVSNADEALSFQQQRLVKNWVSVYYSQ